MNQGRECDEGVISVTRSVSSDKENRKLCTRNAIQQCTFPLNLFIFITIAWTSYNCRLSSFLEHALMLGRKAVEAQKQF